MNRAASWIQLKTSERGTTTSDGPLACRRCAAALQQRQHLDRLAQAHVVGQDAAEAELAGGSRASRGPRADRGGARPWKPAGRVQRLDPLEAGGAARGPSSNAASQRISGCAASSASSRPACSLPKRRRPSSAVPRSASIPYFLSQSSGSIPIEPSPRATMVSPRPAAASRSGRLSAWPPKSTPPAELEPVDPRGHGELELAGRADQLPLGLDPPAEPRPGPASPAPSASAGAPSSPARRGGPSPRGSPSRRAGRRPPPPPPGRGG